MSAAKKSKRLEERKFKRIEIRYGSAKPEHRGFAVQLSSKGAFISANKPIYAAGSNIVIEFKLPAGLFIATAVVRHAKNLPPQMARFGKTGMGIELLSAPDELQEHLDKL